RQESGGQQASQKSPAKQAGSSRPSHPRPPLDCVLLQYGRGQLHPRRNPKQEVKRWEGRVSESRGAGCHPSDYKTPSRVKRETIFPQEASKAKSPFKTKAATDPPSQPGCLFAQAPGEEPAALTVCQPGSSTSHRSSRTCTPARRWFSRLRADRAAAGLFPKAIRATPLESPAALAALRFLHAQDAGAMHSCERVRNA